MRILKFINERLVLWRCYFYRYQCFHEGFTNATHAHVAWLASKGRWIRLVAVWVGVQLCDHDNFEIFASWIWRKPPPDAMSTSCVTCRKSVRTYSGERGGKPMRTFAWKFVKTSFHNSCCAHGRMRPQYRYRFGIASIWIMARKFGQ